VKQLRCAYLTMSDKGDYVTDDSVSVDAMLVPRFDSQPRSSEIIGTIKTGVDHGTNL
jgi:hypothetical protein